MKKYHNVQSEVWKSVFGLAFSAPLFDRYAVDEVIACNQMQGQPTAIVRWCNRCDICANQRDTNAFAKLFFSANHDQSTMPFSHSIDDNIIRCAKIEGKVSPQLSQFSDNLNFVIKVNLNIPHLKIAP